MAVIGFLMCTMNVMADKIHLKSGKVLEGGLKENKNPQGIALLAKDEDWGEEGNGYKTQLIPTGDEYTVGKPMPFHLVMKNVSNDIKWFDAQGISHPVFTVMGPDGKRVRHKVAPFQTGGGQKPIDTGEIVALFEERDITKEYMIIVPGKYTIQFSEGKYGMSAADTFPASNIIEFEVQPGQPLNEDILITSLSGIIPEKCLLTKSWDSNPNGRQPIQGVPIGIFCPGIHRMTSETILWQTDRTVDITGGEEQTKNVEASEYLGKNDSGHIYLSVSSKLEAIWPSIREDIIKTLNLKK